MAPHIEIGYNIFGSVLMKRDFMFRRRKLLVFLALILLLAVAFIYFPQKPRETAGRVDFAILKFEVPEQLVRNPSALNSFQWLTERLPMSLSWHRAYGVDETNSQISLIHSFTSRWGIHGFGYSECPTADAAIIGGKIPLRISKSGEGVYGRTLWLDIRTGTVNAEFPPYGKNSLLGICKQESSSKYVYAYLTEKSAYNIVGFYCYDLSSGSWSEKKNPNTLEALNMTWEGSYFVAGGNIYVISSIRDPSAPAPMHIPYKKRLTITPIEGNKPVIWNFAAFQRDDDIWLVSTRNELPELSAGNLAESANSFSKTGVVPFGSEEARIDYMYMIRPPSKNHEALIAAKVRLEKALLPNALNHKWIIAKFSIDNGIVGEYDIMRHVDWDSSDHPEQYVFDGHYRNIYYDPQRETAYICLVTAGKMKPQFADKFLVALNPDNSCKIIDRFGKSNTSPSYLTLVPDGSLYYVDRKKLPNKIQYRGINYAGVKVMMKYSPETGEKKVVYRDFDKFEVIPSAG